MWALMGTFAFSQTTENTLKIGYTNWEYILQMMPEYKQAESELKSYEKQLQAQMELKMKDYQSKLEVYQKDLNNPAIPDIVKQDREKELISLQSTIKEFEENAYTAMQKKEAQLLDPIIKRIQKAIDEVAVENNYTYILSTGSINNSIILYAKNENDNISDLVLKKLGVTVPKSEGTGTNTNTGTNTTNTANTTNTTNNTTNTNTNTNTNNTTAPVKKKP
jgi:outer membrane protein